MAEDFSVSSTTDSTETRVTIDGLTLATTYYVRVSAFNSTGLEGVFSGSKSHTTDGYQASPPDASAGVTFKKVANNLLTSAIDMSWTAPSHMGTNSDGSDATITGYKVEYSTAEDFSVSTIKDSTGTSINIKGLTAGTKYYVRVSAVNSAGLEGKFSEVKSTCTVSPPGKPTGLIAKTKYSYEDGHYIEVSWTTPSNLGKTSDCEPNQLRYRVQWSPDSNFANITGTHDTRTGAIDYTILDLISYGGWDKIDTKFYVRVKAMNNERTLGSPYVQKLESK